MDDERTAYRVVMNDEAQYSIWPADREPPAGWRAVGPVGTRAACLEQVERVWTDMRPASLARERAS
jgi:MbtH protein